jgi:hypothetical protein
MTNREIGLVIRTDKNSAYRLAIDSKMRDADKSSWVISEYEDGWLIEAPDPQDINQLVSVRGPFRTEQEALDALLELNKE